MRTVYFLPLIFLAVACSTSPTGRKQLIIVPDKQMSEMGFQAFTELKKKTPIEDDPKTNAYVKCISNQILRYTQSNIPVKSWEVVVFRDGSANAFALPGGKIGVHTGLLKVATSADQLAAVIGHEIGHVWARHGSERVSQSVATQSGLAIADLVLDKKNENRGLVLAGLGVGAQFGVLLPFSRKHESEADVIGLELMAKAGFDPRASVKLWQNMAQASGGKSPPQFMSTHPGHNTRIKELQANMSRVMNDYKIAISSGAQPNCEPIN